MRKLKLVLVIEEENGDIVDDATMTLTDDISSTNAKDIEQAMKHHYYLDVLEALLEGK